LDFSSLTLLGSWALSLQQMMRRMLRPNVVVDGCVEDGPLLGDAMLRFRVTIFTQSLDPFGWSGDAFSAALSWRKGGSSRR
jgi:hypothetical protein